VACILKVWENEEDDVTKIDPFDYNYTGDVPVYTVPFEFKIL